MGIAPERPRPDTAYVGTTGSSGVANVQHETEAKIKGAARAPVDAAYGQGRTNMTNNLFGGFFNGIIGFISSLVFALRGITGGLVDLTGALKSTDQKATDAQNAANGAQQTIVDVRKEVIQKIVAFDIKSPTPGYIAINGTEFPSIPKADLKMLPSRAGPGSGNTATSTTGTGSSGSHNHSAGQHVHPLEWNGDPESAMTGAMQRYAFIRIPVDTPLSGLNFYARGAPTDLRTRVYEMSPTGDLTALTEESPNLASLLLPNRHSATPTNFDDVLVEAGTWVCVRFSCVGTVYLAGRELFDADPPAGFYPVLLAATSAAASGSPAPAAISESALSWVGFTVYVAVGNNIVVTPNKRFLSDDFDRPNTSDARDGIGPNWSRAQTSMGLFNQSDGVKVVGKTIVWRGGGDGSAEYTYSRPLTTDKVAGHIVVGEVNATAYSRIMIRKGANSGLGIAVRAGAINLERRGGFNSYATVLPIARTVQAGDVISYQAGTDDHPNEVLVWHNGIEIIRTTSVVVSTGPGFRYGGVFLQRTPNNNSTAIAYWEAYDVPDPESDGEET